MRYFTNVRKLLPIVLLMAGSLTNQHQAQILPVIDNTGAVSVIDSKTIRKNAVNQIEQALNGTITGLYSISNGGQKFGLSNFNFFLRGKATTADNSPLILIDGIDGDIQLLDPDEIESVTVLKDAAVLALYGLRGANGVILIKTKKGSISGNYMKVNVKTGFQSPQTMAQKLNAYEYSTLHNEANINDGGNPVFEPEKHLNQTDPYRYPDTNLPGQFLKGNAPYVHYNFTAGGGNEIARYFALISYMKQDGMFKLPEGTEGLNQAYNERYNFRTNLDVNLGGGFELNTFISAVFDDRRSPWVSSSEKVNNSMNFVFNTLMTTPANAFPLINPDGSPGGSSEYRVNPIGLLRSGKRVENTRKLTANVALSKDLSSWVKGLKAFAQYSFENYNAYFKGNYTSYAVYQLKEDDSYESYGANDTKVTTTGGQMSDYYSDITFNAGAEFNRSFDVHQLHATFLFNQYSSFVAGDNPAYKWLGVASQVQYAYNNRYFAQLSSSYQGSNSYAGNQRYGFFPAASLAWVISNEDFMNDVESINLLKVRMSYGMTGNNKTGGARFMHRQAYYNGNGYGFGNPNGTSQGSWEGTLGNPDASWETDGKFNLGMNVSALDNQLSFSADYFHENRSSILVNQSNLTPALIGISLPQYNAGVIMNRGIETDLTYSSKKGAVHFQSGINLLFARNTIIDLKEMTYPENESYRYRKGNPVNAIFGYETDGIYNDYQSITNHNIISSFGALVPGDIKYIDQNGDGIINDADKKVIGNAFPELIYGLHAGLSVHGFDLFVQMEGSALFDLHLRPEQLSKYAWENRWTSVQSGANAPFPRLSFNSDHNMQTSAFWLQKGNLMRLSSLEVGYTIPKSLVKKVSLSDVRVYAHLHNLLSTTNQREQRDMEAPGAGFSTYPLMKTILVGLSVTL